MCLISLHIHSVYLLCLFFPLSIKDILIMSVFCFCRSLCLSSSLFVFFSSSFLLTASQGVVCLLAQTLIHHRLLKSPLRKPVWCYTKPVVWSKGTACVPNSPPWTHTHTHTHTQTHTHSLSLTQSRSQGRGVVALDRRG